MTRILIVDDDPVQLRLTAEIARRAGFVPVTATGGEEALRLMRGQPGFGAVILDLVMPDLDGMAVMEAMAREAIATPVIVQTAHSGMETVVTAMRKGAVDFFTKPVAPERLVVSLRNALKLGELEMLVRSTQNRRAGQPSLADIVTRSPAMHRTLAQTQKAAKTLLPVLIEGESGTGRDLLARVICGLGERAARPFIAVNCATLSGDEAERYLFGTDAEPGRIAAAQGGTLLLDEIGELTPAAQARLMKLVSDGQLEPVGATRPERANIRVIAATSTRLLNLAQAGDFREDLYYRLNVFPIYLPPLRERTEDIEPLARHFLTRSAAETGRRVSGLTGGALDLLVSYAWPGNVRQLEGAVHRAVALSEGGQLDAADFPQILALARGREEAERLTLAAPVPSAPVHIDAHRKRDEAGTAPDRFLDATGEVAPLPDLERDLIAFAIQHYGGRMSKVARALRIGRSTLYRKLREYGLEDRAESDAA
jgi:DNA-binding NtrC family response regulator